MLQKGRKETYVNLYGCFTYNTTRTTCYGTHVKLIVFIIIILYALSVNYSNHFWCILTAQQPVTDIALYVCLILL